MTALDHTLFGVLLEDPKHRMLHVSPLLQRAKADLISIGFMESSGALTDMGLVAQRLIKEASPRRRSYRREDELFWSILRGRKWGLTHDEAKALTKTALSTLLLDGWIEHDPNDLYGGAYRWRA